MEQPLISVIMGTYNPNLDHLETAIKSVINQSYTNWELWLCDDGSDGEIQEQIKELAQIDQRIHYLKSETNKGLAASLNTCLKYAKGEFIARMDDDDYSTTDRFDKQIMFLLNNCEYSWVGSLAFLYDENGIWGEGYRVEKPTKQDFLKYSPYIHPSVMFRKSAFNQAGKYCTDDVALRCEDYELFMRFTSKGLKGYNIQEKLLWYQESSLELKRKWRFCLNEVYIRMQGFSRMKMNGILPFIYFFKPIVVYIISRLPFWAQYIRVRKPDGNCKIGR